MARVVVVGGGYGGVTVAKGLDPLAEVILVEQKDQFVHHAAALRAAVDEAWQHSIFMPYSNLLSNGRVIHGTVSQVEGTRVHIFGQDPIDADYVVLATGSTYPFPAKYSASRSDVAKARLKQLHSYLHGARSVLLVGAGTVGIEFAGELRNAFPDLEITLLEKQSELLPTQGFAEELRDQVREQLKELNIRLIEGSELAYLPPFNVGELGRFVVETKDGHRIEADMWFQCYGARPNTGYVAGTELQSAVRPDGALKVEPTLQVVGQTNIYAIGDVTDVRESKRADAARAQARIVISNISSQLSGKEPQATYNPSDEWVILPLGPEHGVSQLLDSQGNSRILGPDQTAEIKGADLMVSVIRSQLNLP